MQALELVRCTVKPGAEDAFVRARPKAIEALRARCPGLVDGHLARVDDTTWVDVLVWESREQALAAAEKAPQVPEVAEWFGVIDEVLAMEHAEVVHAV